MATITLNIPNPVANRIMDAISAREGYSAFLADGTTPNPQSKQDFVKTWLIGVIKNTVRQHEAEVAKAAAESNVSTDVENNISIT